MADNIFLASQPKWYFAALNGQPLAGGQLFTKSALNPTQDKPFFQDPGATQFWPNPIVLDANGTSGPFYGKTDTSITGDAYLLEVKDANNNVLYTVNNYTNTGSSGGGGTVDNFIQFNNLIANNVFLDHMDSMGAAANLTNQLVCPSNHVGFSPDTPSPTIGPNGAIAGDIRFLKNATGLATDQITFVNFGLGTTPLGTYTTPLQYLRYQASSNPVGETLKCFQFPITHGVKNLENTAVTFTVWAKVTATPVTLGLSCRQYFGSGNAASTEVLTPVGSIGPLTTTWAPYTVQFTIPGIGSPTLSLCGDDALYMQLGMPLSSNCDVQFTKPFLAVGTFTPNVDYVDDDQINSITQTPRTGENKTHLAMKLSGWVPAIDGTIGSAASSASIRSNVDTFPLYKLLWDSVSQTYAPVTGGVRGADAVTDFLANKPIALTRMLGRVVTGNNASFINAVNFTADFTTNTLTWASAANLPTSTPVILSTSVTLPSPLVAGVIYYVINLSTTTFRLATSPDNAINAITVVITDNGTGTHTCNQTLGAIYGEGVHTLTIDEMPSHAHTTSRGQNYSAPLSTNILTNDIASGTVDTGFKGGGLPHNTVQPSTLYNMFFKL